MLRLVAGRDVQVRVHTLGRRRVNILMVGGKRKVVMHTMHGGNMNSQAEKMAELTNLDPAWGLILSVYGDHSEGIHLIREPVKNYLADFVR